MSSEIHYTLPPEYYYDPPDRDEHDRDCPRSSSRLCANCEGDGCQMCGGEEANCLCGTTPELYNFPIESQESYEARHEI